MNTKKAFTIIELMLAMAFLGTMLLGIATLILQITNIYQKGLSIRGINAVGREIISDLTRTVEASRVNVAINPSSTKSNGDINTEISDELVRRARADYFVETVKDGKQMGGVFCTGSYSYVWNTAENIRIARNADGYLEGKISDASVNKLLNDGVFIIRKKDGYIVPKLVRFVDNERNACLHTESVDRKKFEPAGDENQSIKKDKTLFDVSEYSDNSINELIQENEADLVLYDFSILPATQNPTTYQIFYSGTFILATLRGGVNILSNGDFCQGSDKEDGSIDNAEEYTGNDFDYCAVNKFNFAIRATGETGINQHGEN